MRARKLQNLASRHTHLRHLNPNGRRNHGLSQRGYPNLHRPARSSKAIAEGWRCTAVVFRSGSDAVVGGSVSADVELDPGGQRHSKFARATPSIWWRSFVFWLDRKVGLSWF